MNVLWKTIPDFSNYEASTTGYIRRKNFIGKNGFYKQRILLESLPNSKRKYRKLDCTLQDDFGCTKTVKVHLAVLTAFKGPRPEGCVGRHLDDNKNNNSIGNLEWGTPTENTLDAIKNNRLKRGKDNHKTKLTEADVIYIRKNFKYRDENFSGVALSKRFGVSQTSITSIIHRKTWNYI